MSHKMFTINNRSVSGTSEDIPLQLSDFTSESNTQTNQVISYDGTSSAWKNKDVSGGEAFSLTLSQFLDDSSGVYISSSMTLATDDYIPSYISTQYGNNQRYTNAVDVAYPNTHSVSGAFLQHVEVQNAGTYLCICMLGSFKTSYGSLETLRWVKNGTAFGAYYQVDKYNRRPTTMVAVVQCAANDTLGVKFQDGSGGMKFQSSDGQKQHSLSIYKL